MRKHLGLILFIVCLLGAMWAVMCGEDADARGRQRRQGQRVHMGQSLGAAGAAVPDASVGDVSDAAVADVSDAFVADVSDAFVADVSDAAGADASDASVGDAFVNGFAFAPDGVSETITVADSSAFDGDLNSFTICAWIREATYNVTDVIMVKNTAAQREWNFRISSATAGALQLCVQSGLANTACPASCSETSASMTGGTAYFVCAVYDGAQAVSADRITLYNNGAVNAETCAGTQATAFVDGTSIIEIAQFGAAGQFGAGFMDEITYWNNPLTANQINTLCCGSTSCGGVCNIQTRMDAHGIASLQLYLDFDGDLASYTTATDEAGGDNSGTYVNCANAAACITSTLP